MKFSPFNHLASDVSQLKKEIESGKLAGYKNTLRFNPETAGSNSSTDSISIDQIKEQGRKMKGQMLVFKGLYLGMQKSHAIKLLKSYGCDIGSVSLYGRDGKVETIILTRTVIDVLFKTSGVSADNFCKTFVSAYVGLCAELAFYHRFKETMRLVPALDSGDHVDFVGVLKDKRIKIDVTTSLESKKKIWQHFASDNAHLIAVVNEAKNWCRFYQADKVQGGFWEAGQKRRYKLHT